MTQIKVLFVCLGNICRSPLAEGIFLNQIRKLDLTKKVDCDSAATSTSQIGDAPDHRSQKIANKFGIRLTHIARQTTEGDLENFDYILAMDEENFKNINLIKKNSTSPSSKAKIKMMLDFHPDPSFKEVPDPYYGTIKDFENVFNLLETANEGLIKFLKKEHSWN